MELDYNKEFYLWNKNWHEIEFEIELEQVEVHLKWKQVLILQFQIWILDNKDEDP